MRLAADVLGIYLHTRTFLASYLKDCGASNLRIYLKLCAIIDNNQSFVCQGVIQIVSKLHWGDGGQTECIFACSGMGSESRLLACELFELHPTVL